MPEKTDADWQALGARIAREVMGWFKWDELPTEAQTAFLALSDACRATRFHYTTSLEMKPTTQWNEVRLDRLRRSWWSLKAEDPASDQSECPTIVMWIYDWQPHKDVAQAVLARDRVVQRGWDFVLGASLSGQLKILVVAAFAPEAGVGMFESERSADTDAKAICLAIGRWLDAQKEKQDDED